MKKKYFLFAMVFIGSVFMVCLSICAEKISAVSLETNIAPVASLGAPAADGNMTGSGYINFETKNVDALYEHVRKAMATHQGAVNSYNRSATPDAKYKNINVEVIVDLSRAASFMNDLSGLKEIKSQNYNQYPQREGDINTLKNEIEALNERLHKAVFSAKPDVEVIKLIVTKVTETENKINQLKTRDPMIGKARINISIQQEGYSDYNNRNKSGFLSLAVLVVVIGALVCFIGGLITGKVLVRRAKPNTTSEGDIV